MSAPEYTEGGWLREGYLEVCPECRRAREGTISWYLAHGAKCEWRPAGTWLRERIAAERADERSALLKDGKLTPHARECLNLPGPNETPRPGDYPAPDARCRKSPGARAQLSAADDALTVLWNAIRAATIKHPSGPDGMRSLAEEVGEVASAMRRETTERVREELIDVAVIAIRWWSQLGASEPSNGGAS